MHQSELSHRSAVRACLFRTALLALVLCGMLAGCVYRINIQQGNFLDPQAVEQLNVGMTRSQVRFLLGTPMVSDVFDNDRWDYVYYFKRGRSRAVDEQRVTVHFDGDRVSRIDKPAGAHAKVAKSGADQAQAAALNGGSGQP